MTTVAEHILGDPLGAHDEESRARGFVLGVFVRVRGGTAGGGTGGGRRVRGGAGPRLRVGVVGEHDAQEAFTPSEKSPRRGDAALERAFAVRLVAHRLERARCRGGARELDVRHALVPEHAHGPHLAERREEIPKLGLRHAATAHHEQPRVRRAGRLGHRHAPGTNRSSRRAVRDGVGGGANPVNERPRVEPGRRDETRDKSRFRQRILSPSSHNRWHLCDRPCTQRVLPRIEIGATSSPPTPNLKMVHSGTRRSPTPHLHNRFTMYGPSSSYPSLR